MNTPDCPQKKPYVVTVKPGKYAWCACGKSEKQPFCDGRHQAEGLFQPVIVDIKEEKRMAWCGCKRTANPPLCDGTHGKL